MPMVRVVIVTTLNSTTRSRAASFAVRSHRPCATTSDARIMSMDSAPTATSRGHVLSCASDQMLDELIAPVVGTIARAFAEQPAHEIDRRLVQPLVDSDGSKSGDADEANAVRRTRSRRDRAPTDAQRERRQSDAHLPSTVQQATPHRLRE